MHPLSPDLTQLSDVDLHKNHGELIKRLTQAHRVGPYSIIGQLQMLLEDYNIEIQRRNSKAMEDMMKKSQGNNRGGIIDIQ